MPHTLLLADDSVTIQRVIELTFADEDVHVVAVSDGDQAIAALNQTPPDIVLADVGMPGRDGYQVAEHIKNTPHLAHIPVVLLTGAFEPIDQARAEQAGCDGVLAKPFEPQQVIGRVRELLAKPRPHVSQAIDSHLSPPLLDLPLAAGRSKPLQPAGVENYFDRLDQAFASLTGGPPQTTAKASAPVDDAGDWFSTSALPGTSAAVPDRWDAPASAPAPSATSASDRSRQPVQRVEPTPSAYAAPAPLPPLADAFAAILAAEQAGPVPSAAPSWPGRPAPAVEMNELVEDVVRRVLEQLSDRVVRETVSDIVSKVAERLVREEIERMKQNIK